MYLYILRPSIYGFPSYFVVSDSELNARKAAREQYSGFRECEHIYKCVECGKDVVVKEY
jgi:hypothetical protein